MIYYRKTLFGSGPKLTAVQSQVIGKTDFDLFPKKVAEFFRQKDQEMLAEGKERINQEELIYPDGHKVMVETLKSPIRNQQGQIIGLVGICRASK
jgi:PAS domain S-box-containing protein